MSDVLMSLSQSSEWRAAYSQAIRDAKKLAERRFIALLAKPIAAGNSNKIAERITSFNNLVKQSSIEDLKHLESGLSNDRRGIGRLCTLELSTGFRNRLLRKIHSRIARHNERLANYKAATEARESAGNRGNRRSEKGDRLVVTNIRLSGQGTEVSLGQVGPYGIGLPERASSGKVVVRIDGRFPEKEQARSLIVYPFMYFLKDLQTNAKVEDSYSGSREKGYTLSLAISDADESAIMSAAASVGQAYRNEVNASRITEEEYQERLGYKAWAGMLAKFGNIYNPAPFLEFTPDGEKFSMNPQDGAVIVKGWRAIRKLQGRGTVNTKSFKPWLKNPGSIKQLQRLWKSIDKAAWKNAINNLNKADKELLNALKQAEKDVLQLIRAGKEVEAYRMIKKWRRTGGKLYDRIRDKYLQDPTVRKKWEKAGADMSKNAPQIDVAVLENGVRYRQKMTITLEHLTRKNDNPFMAVSANNLKLSLKHENSVFLEWLRRIEKGMNTVWSNGPIEELVRRIEGKIE